MDPEDARAYNGKGNSLYALMRYVEALASYDHAIQLNPQYALAYNGKGDTLKAQGRMAEAEQAYQKARELGS